MTLPPSSGIDPQQPIGLAIAGLGGFAANITNRIILAAQEFDTPPFRIVAVGDPAAAIPAMAERRAELEALGTVVVEDFYETLAMPEVQVVWLPVPIQLHRRFVEASYAAGKHVICEKPLAGCVEDVDAMIASRDAAGLTGLVGFHDLFHANTMAIKRRLLAGEIGEVNEVTVFGSWPRDTGYFSRANWAGRKSLGGIAVNDSPANNAMAHYLMLSLFFMGDKPWDAATPASAEAQTWRTRPIENFDTVDARFAFADGRTLRLLLTHSSQEQHQPQIILKGTKGTWVWTNRPEVTPLVPVQEHFFCPADTEQQLIGAVAKVLTGEAGDDQPYATFEAARAHATAIEMIQSAGETMTLESPKVEQVKSTNEGALIHHVPGLVEAMREAAMTGGPLAI